MSEEIYETVECRNDLIRMAEKRNARLRGAKDNVICDIMDIMYSEWFDILLNYLKLIKDAGYSYDDIWEIEKELIAAWDNFCHAVEQILNKYIDRNLFYPKY